MFSIIFEFPVQFISRLFNSCKRKPTPTLSFRLQGEWEKGDGFGEFQVCRVLEMSREFFSHSPSLFSASMRQQRDKWPPTVLGRDGF
jgi:hypothetical protein